MTAVADFFGGLLDTEGFPARWQCGDAWTPFLGWLHIVSDIAIFGAYAAIPATLAVFLSRRRDIPFPLTGWLFVAFILSCGIGHLMDSMLFWWPAYRLSGLIKVATATVSWATVLSLAIIFPKVLGVPDALRSAERMRVELSGKDEALRTQARTRTTIEARSAELTLRLTRLQAALEASMVAAVQWEVDTGVIVWQVGADGPLRHLGVSGREWTNWAQALGEEALRALRAAERDAVARDAADRNPAFDATFPIPGGALRMAGSVDPVVRGERRTITGMLRFMPPGAGA